MADVRYCDDWIDSYLQLTENSEPPYLFRLWSAISVVASVLKRKCRIDWGSITFYPNMYIVLVAPSGRARKGTAMAPAMDFLVDTNVKLAAEAITREALIRLLVEVSDNDTHPATGEIDLHSSLTIFSPELTVFLGYQNQQLLSDLTDWYDCRNKWIYRTKNMGTDEIIGVWVNLFGATTPDLIQTAMPLDAIGGGLTSRMIFVYEQNKGKIVPAPFYSKAELELRDHLLYDLNYIHMMKGAFKFTRPFVDAWTEWYIKQEGDPPFKDPRFAGYVERRPTHIMKLCMILNASHTDKKVIDVPDLERAIGILAQTEKKMPLAFGGVGKSRMADIINKISAEVAFNPGITLETLYKRFIHDADKWTMNKALETLEAARVIDIIDRADKGMVVEMIDPNSPYLNKDE